MCPRALLTFGQCGFWHYTLFKIVKRPLVVPFYQREKEAPTHLFWFKGRNTLRFFFGRTQLMINFNMSLF